MQPPQWKGQQSQRFSGGRAHLTAEGELNNLMQPSHAAHPFGIRTYQEKLSDSQQFKPCLKTFEANYKPNQKEIDLRGIKYLTLPQQAERHRKQRGHIPGGFQTNKEQELKGIKTFDGSNQRKNEEYIVETKMQTKMRILGLDGQRNNIGVSSLGDKPYKYPEYESDFYKAGGLISGATSFKVRTGENITPDPSKLKSIFTKPMWYEKVKMEEEEEEKRAVDAVDDWQQTILKEANPKWNDPDTFFERMEKAANAGGKDAKKGAKK